ncbi:cephalotocin receptor 1-like [Saccostrea echinata]|uniref:cephalotocin receptor 1-like n=1 Tax=Saccostrea echinata TaxID=191078 RepID=UPI002A8399AE|nr:cephalotocin receptor 1-like [Saccostrea echinata]
MDDKLTTLNKSFGNNISSKCFVTAQFAKSDTTNHSVNLNRDETLAQAEISVQVVIFVLAVFGNATVLAVLLPRKKSRMYLFMMHLSLADLFVAFCNVLPQLIWDITYVFIGNDILCRFVKYLQIVVIYASSYVMLMSAIDRYIAICHPFFSHKIRSGRVHLMVFIAWCLSLILPVPQLLIFSYKRREDGQYDCWATFDPAWTLQLYITYFTFSVYIIPMIILTFCYGRICFVVIKRSHRNEQLVLSRRISSSSIYHDNIQDRNIQAVKFSVKVETCRANGISRAKIKTVRLTLAVVLCYFICWTPFFLFQLWAAYDPSAPYTSTAFVIILLLASLNSCTNPWIYLAFSDGFMDRIRRWKTGQQPTSHCALSGFPIQTTTDGAFL